MTNKDRREYFRIFTSRLVTFTVEGHTYRGVVGNAGDNGVFITTRGNFSVGQGISMTFESPIFGNEERSGMIIWVGSQEKGIGVEFKNVLDTREITS
ncbi:MAG TPA: PilZ domain-containing protein [Desulfobacterales bacterium]|nr:PilZ domain-containing protein [Desulfobacterales bacterium]